MLSKLRLFSSKQKPYMKGLLFPESITFNVSGTKIKLECPCSSSWNRDYNEITVRNVDLDDHTNFLGFYNYGTKQNAKYSCLTLLYREWSLFGSVVRFDPVAVASIQIRLIYVPPGKTEKCLFSSDDLVKSFPMLFKKRVGDDFIKSGAGRLNNILNVHYSRHRFKAENTNHVNDVMYIEIDCNHLFLIEMFNAKAPDIDKSIFKAMESVSDKIITSIDVVRSNTHESMRRFANKRYAETNDLYYDEKMGEALHAIDLDE